MTLTNLNRYKNLLIKLRDTANECAREMQSNDLEDTFFTRNANFLTGSFVISTCSYLESYLKDSVTDKISSFNERIENLGMPKSLVLWSVNPGQQGKQGKQSNLGIFKIDLTEDDIDRKTSPDIDKTIKLFSLLGIDLDSDDNFRDIKDRIGSIVDKRNQIIHHNNDASDISVLDAISYINTVIEYIEILDKNFWQSLYIS